MYKPSGAPAPAFHGVVEVGAEWARRRALANLDEL